MSEYDDLHPAAPEPPEDPPLFAQPEHVGDDESITGPGGQTRSVEYLTKKDTRRMDSPFPPEPAPIDEATIHLESIVGNVDAHAKKMLRGTSLWDALERAREYLARLSILLVLLLPVLASCTTTDTGQKDIAIPIKWLKDNGPIVIAAATTSDINRDDHLNSAETLIFVNQLIARWLQSQQPSQE